MDSTKKTTWGIGLKLTLGLSALIVLSVIIGVLSIFSMLSVQGNSGDLSDQYMPAIQISSKIESSTKNIMLGMRGFSLSNDIKYFQDAQKAMKDMDDALNAGSDLVAKNNKLEDFKKELAQAIDLYKKYTDIIQQTKDANDKVLQARDDLNKAVADFQANFNPLYDTETKRFQQVIASGARGAVLQETAISIEKVNKISDLVDEIRIGNLKSQAMNDNSYVEKIMPDFDLIAGNCDELIKITKDSTVSNQLSQIKAAVFAYQKGVQNYFENDKKMNDIVAIRSKMGDTLSSFAVNVNAMSIKQGLDTANVNKLVVQSANWFIVIGLIVAMIVGVVLAIVLTRSITGPLSVVTLLSKRVTRGDFEIERKKIASQDELGQLTLAFYEMVDGLQSKAKIIESIAGGNLNNDIKLASDEDALGRSLQTMQNSLNEILSQVNIAVEQIAGGSDQVSTAAQSLSQGATEQASSLEEISASSNEIHSQSKQNAEAATTANQLAKQASNSAKDGNQQMVNLMSLLEKMTKSSEDTKKIVKTIDDIAFQVNLLALNANVEAARAGKYGKGFAVVAEEVRNLAVRSASAVNETTQMVEDSIKNIQEVNATAKNTGTQLEGILVNANKVADFLEEITAASQEQARAMGQINGGLDQIDQVTQSNTASAEESASAAEELSGQAQQLKVMVARFQLSDAYTSKQRTLAGATVKPARVMTTSKQNAPQVKKNSPKEPSDIILNDDFETF